MKVPLQRPTRAEVSVFPTRAAFRAWMEEHHDTTDALWVGYYRRGIGKPSIGYADAVDVALAYGWIDGLTYRVDDEVHTNRFTPRRRGSNWSAVNVARMERIIASGEAHPAGIAAFEARVPARSGVYSYENAPRELPPTYEAPLRANSRAWAYWRAQPPSYRRTVTHWVLSAKQEATRERRLATLIEDCAAERWVRVAAYGRTRGRRP